MKKIMVQLYVSKPNARDAQVGTCLVLSALLNEEEINEESH